MHGCENARSFLCVIFSSPSLVCYVSDNILPASSGSSCVIKAPREHMLSEREQSCVVRNESESDVSSLTLSASHDWSKREAADGRH